MIEFFIIIDRILFRPAGWKIKQVELFFRKNKSLFICFWFIELTILESINNVDVPLLFFDLIWKYNDTLLRPRKSGVSQRWSASAGILHAKHAHSSSCFWVSSEHDESKPVMKDDQTWISHSYACFWHNSTGLSKGEKDNSKNIWKRPWFLKIACYYIAKYLSMRVQTTINKWSCVCSK